jgi:hypothetical protein
MVVAGAVALEVTSVLYPRLISWVRFTDDAALNWEIDTSLHLKKLAKRDWQLD